MVPFFIEDNSLVIIAVFLGMFHCLNVTNYLFLSFYGYFKTDFTSLFGIISSYSNHRNASNLPNILAGCELSSNRFMSTKQKLQLMRVFETLQKTYLCVVLLLILLIAAGAVCLLYYISFAVQLYEFGIRSYLSILESILGTILFSSACLIPNFVAHLTVLQIYANQITWGEFCRKFQRNDHRFWRRKHDSDWMNIYRQLKHCHRVFVQSLTMLRKIDRLGVHKIFKVSTVLNLIINIIGILELVVGTLSKGTKLFILWALMLQLGIILSVMIFFLRTAKQLYALNGSILHYQIEFSKHSFSREHLSCRLRSMVHWNRFVEIVHSRRKFVFSLGSFGKITSGNIIRFVPLYTSLLFLFIPMIVSKRKRSYE